MQLTFPSIEGALWCLGQRGFRPRLAIDIGAYHGEWTQMFKRLYTGCAVIMIEAQEAKADILGKICDGYQGDVGYRIALLGPSSGVATRFVEMETGSSVFEENSPYQRQATAKNTLTLDDLLGELAQQVDMLKLDVQGYELEVLKGCTQSLRSAKAVLMEASLIPINAGCPLIGDVMAFMGRAGFRLADFCSQIRRADGALWQTDLLFLRETSGLLPEPKLTMENWG